MSDLQNLIENSIIEYENQEKKEKEGAKLGVFIGIIILLIWLVGQYYKGDISFTPINFIGFSIMLAAALKSVYSNRTDDFPDARILATKEYLIKVKEDIYSRRKRHLTNTILALGLYIPAMFLAFYNIYAKEEIGGTLNIILMCGLGVGAIFIIIHTIRWFKKYDERTMPLKQELDELIAEIN